LPEITTTQCIRCRAISPAAASCNFRGGGLSMALPEIARAQLATQAAAETARAG
jgi:hypothetical protein